MTETNFILQPGAMLTMDGPARPFRMVGAAVDAKGQVWAQVPAHVFADLSHRECVIRMFGSDVVVGVRELGDDIALVRGADSVAPGHLLPLDMLITSFRIAPEFLGLASLEFGQFWPKQALAMNTVLNVRVVSLTDYLEMDGRPENATGCGQVSATHGLVRMSMPDGSDARIYGQAIEIDLDPGRAELASWELFLSQDGGLIGPAVATDGRTKIVASLHGYLHMRDLKLWTPPNQHNAQRKRVEALGVGFDLVHGVLPDGFGPNSFGEVMA